MQLSYKYLTNLLFDNADLITAIYNEDKKNELPPSVESILDKFFEYNKIILFKNINKNISVYENIIKNIKEIIKKHIHQLIILNHTHDFIYFN